MWCSDESRRYTAEYTRGCQSTLIRRYRPRERWRKRDVEEVGWCVCGQRERIKWWASTVLQVGGGGSKNKQKVQGRCLDNKKLKEDGSNADERGNCSAPWCSVTAQKSSLPASLIFLLSSCPDIQKSNILAPCKTPLRWKKTTVSLL